MRGHRIRPALAMPAASITEEGVLVEQEEKVGVVVVLGQGEGLQGVSRL